jgi:hypothetical protein
MNIDDGKFENKSGREEVGGEAKRKVEADVDVEARLTSEVRADTELDARLDAALVWYAKAEPRAGLEGRVLARLAETRRESNSGRRWWGALAFGMAAVLVIAGWVEQSHRGGLARIPAARVDLPSITEPRGEQAHLHGSGSQVSALRQSVSAKRSALERHAGRGQADRSPKLEQFPSAAPLNEQEALLARYVREFPERATLVARAQTELRKQDELEMTAPWPAKTGDSSEER